MAGLPGVEGVQVPVIRYFLKFFEMVILEISQTESYTILFKRDKCFFSFWSLKQVISNVPGHLLDMPM